MPMSGRFARAGCVLIDTDVLIWLFRGRESARRAIDKVATVELSAITYMELVQGMRNKDEFRMLRRTVYEHGWRVLPLTENVSHRATVYIETYALSHGMKLADALVAASAVESGTLLMTANVKHYKVVPDVELVRYKP